MKKNLLSLALILSAGIYTSAQNTYINDAVTVKVNPNTLFFHGGDVTITNTSGDTKKIINDGNIQIAGNFSNTSTTGKNFVNTYSAGDNFGQLIINQESTGITGRISMERRVPEPDNDYYNIGFPFKNTVNDPNPDNQQTIDQIINSMVGHDIFQGICLEDIYCGKRFLQTALKWNSNKTRYDAVPSGATVDPGKDYTIKLSTRDFQNLITNLNNANENLTLFGIPNNSAYVESNVKSTITDGNQIVSDTNFSGYMWSQWKNKTNVYGETYLSYLGNGINGVDGNYIFGKNVHRFSNPFTSNIDLSIINKPGDGDATSWISFMIGGVPYYPTSNNNNNGIEIWNTIRFKVSKLPTNLTVNWSNQIGSTNTGSGETRISAYLQKADSGSKPYFWAGSAEALIVKPFEFFDVNYYSLHAGRNGNTRLITANYNITDVNKTFKQDYTYTNLNNSENTAGIYARNSEFLNDPELINRGLVGPNDFTQLEFYLTKNNTILDEAAYLVNSSFYNTGTVVANNQLNNKLFLYEESTNGTINRNSQTLLNEFKNDYEGKPLGIGFKNLTNGDQYTIKLRLFEYSILNRVNNFNNGTYYLYDRNTNQVSEINGNSEISFVADDNINNRFELYWNEVPRTLATDDLTTSKATLVYFNNDNQYIRFEDNNTKASVKVFDLTGRLIANHLNVNTNEDLKLNINKGAAIYIVNITYENGKTVSKKIIQN